MMQTDKIPDNMLVPREEWPYTLPDGWNIYRGSIFKFEKGKKPSELFDEELPDTIPYVNIKYFEIGIAEQYTKRDATNRFCEKEDILIVWDGARSGLIGTNAAGALGSTLSKIKFNGFNGKYVYYYFLSKYDEINTNTRGTGIPHVDPTFLNSLLFPAPHLAEQKRIVDTIEKELEEIDQATKLAQEAYDSFALRKAAFLHKAFTGELTAEWREENGLDMDSWEEKKLSEVCLKITDGTHNSPKNFPSGDYMYITAKNIKENFIDLNNITYVSEKDHKDIYTRCNVEYGDVLYIKDGATTGIAAINNIHEEFSMLSSVALIKPISNIINNRFLTYQLNSPYLKGTMINNMSGNAITRLTIVKLKIAKVLVPTLKEQKEIVRILDKELTKEQQAKELCQEVLEESKLIKKSFLARAFRGLLVTK